MNKKGYHNTKSSNKALIPVVLMMGFIPMIVHMIVYNCNLSQFDWFSANMDTQADFFFGWKMIAIIVVGIAMIGVLLYTYLKKKQALRFENSFYFLFIYAMFVAMSALFSGYKYWVARGTFELFEPVWVVFAYMLLCYYTYHFVQEEKQLRFVLAGAGIGMAVVTVIGVFQYFHMDFFKTNFARHLITNTSMWDRLNDISFNMEEGTSYTTLYNPNFLSFYFGMLIPLLVCLFIVAKKIWQRVLLVVAEVLCLICLKGSGSDTGWMAIMIGVLIAALVLLSRKKKAFYVALAIVLIGGVAAVTVGTGTSIGSRIKDTIVGTYHYDEQFALHDVDTGTDDVMLDIRGNKLYLSYSLDESGSAQPAAMDADGQSLELVLTDEANKMYALSDTRYEGVSVQSVALGESSTPAIAVWVDGISWNFLNISGDGYYYCNTAGKLVKFPQVKNANLFREDAMSMRGRMWNMTIPLLGKHVFMGSGANTFLFEYPQNDYLGQVYIYGGSSLEVKAHCWYLQQWVETGLIGLLALLIFIGFYVVRSVKIYRRVDLHEGLNWIGFGLFTAVLVYLAAAIANDSNVCTAPVFWGMLGLGLAVNRMIAEKNGILVKATGDAASDAELTTGRKSDANQVANPDVEKKTDKKPEADAGQNEKEKAAQNSDRKQNAKKQSRKQRKSQKK